MTQPSSQCNHAPGMDVLDKIIDLPGRLPYELVSILVQFSLDLDDTFEASLCRDPIARFAVLLAREGPFCQSGCAGQHGGGNDPDFSSSGGFDHPGMAGFSGLDSPELAHSPWTPHGSKRKRGGRDPVQPPKSGSIIKPIGRTFACPFYLHDRIRHSDCLNIRLTRLSDVRQHLLERAHYQAVHCPVCGVTFQGRLGDARRQRNAHVEERICVPSPSPFNYPGITEDQEQTIREIARNTRGNQFTEFQRWFMIWDFLFPGEPRPESPWLNDIADIQRVVDWTSFIFENDLWLRLPNEPWTAAMGLEERRAGMTSFMGSFIVLVRDFVGQDEAPVEDHHGADYSSSMGGNTPAPSVATSNPGLIPPASNDFNRPPDPSRQAYLSPTSLIGSRQAPSVHTSGQREPTTTNLLAPIPFRPMNNPARVVPQDIQPPAPPEEAVDTEHDPTLPSQALEGSSVELLTMDPELELWTFMFRSQDAGADDRHDPAGGSGL